MTPEAPQRVDTSHVILSRGADERSAQEREMTRYFMVYVFPHNDITGSIQCQQDFI